MTTAAVIEVVLATAVLGGGAERDRAPLRPILPEARAVRGDPVAGATVFVRAGCGRCHTLAVAGARGTAGPNLDRHASRHRHRLDDFITIVRDGRGAMPPMKDRLTPKEIRDVATFVVGAAGRRDR